MWPRLAHNKTFRKGSMWLAAALGLFLCSACNRPNPQRIDKLNSLAYAQHYRSLDSVDYYVQEQFHPVMGIVTIHYDDGEAEQRNNMAFRYIAKMEYDTAEYILNTIPEITDNQLELLVCYVQQMRLCQRRSSNKEFYDYREQALNCLKRINEERDLLNSRQQKRLLYGETELAIVTSTYYYYVGLNQQSVEALMAIDAEEVKRDTAQFLNYLYNIGAGGILTKGTADDIYQQEMDYLLRCYQIAKRDNFPYFVANALEALAEHLTSAPPGDEFFDRGLAMVNPDGLTDHNELAVNLAERSLRLFEEYGDVYQIAGAYRTLASCHRAMGNDEATLYYLEKALADTVIQQAPDLVASIYERLSVAYAAIDDKPNSDHYRNLYLDLHEQTRQDRQLEARAGQLDRSVTQLDWILAATVGAILLLVFLLWLFRRLNRQRPTENPLEEQLEERREQLAVSRLHIEEGERRHLEQRAKISLVNSLMPLIDRMVYTINRQGDKDYVRELTYQIEADNEMLTQWIQLRQGQLNLHIESFPLQALFDIVARSQKSFQMKGIELRVEPTDAMVKADRILTLFMLNTLADNARKFTDKGHVDIKATQTKDYVEIAVADTGCGMDKEQLAHIFEAKPIKQDNQPTTAAQQQSSHGFGLLNCKGIIEKYRKLSQLFSVCTLQAESRAGEGSRFFFRLPLGKVLTAIILWLAGFSLPVNADGQQPANNDRQPTTNSRQHLTRAAIYADSAYFSNINGNYERTLLFADSCRMSLNAHYRSLRPKGTTLLSALDDGNVTPAEVLWLRDSVNTNYNLILDIRNESAVAALALHQWERYQYNNRVYNQMYKELSADATLADYCRTMQRTKENRTIAVVLLLIALLAILPVWYFYYMRPRLQARFQAEQASREDLEVIDDEQRRADLELANLHVSNAVLDNCLSTLKHETMYYPSRIRQLIEQDDISSAAEVVDYYRELYNLLSLQAQSQVERVKLHLRPVTLHGQTVLGDDNLLRYLFQLIKPAEVSARRLNDQYVEYNMRLDKPLSTYHAYICRQIMRDHGEATNRRACSFRIDQENNQIIIILPAYGKLQSNHS